MRGRYVVLVMLVVAVGWMHRRTGDAAAVAPTPTTITATPPRTFVISTPRPELPPATTPEADDPPATHAFVGRVTDTRGRTQAGATVIAHGPITRGAKTDGHGEFRIDELPAGDYTLIYFAGSAGMSVDVTIAGDEPEAHTAVAMDLDVPTPARLLEWQEVEIAGLPSPYEHVKAAIDGRDIDIEDPDYLDKPVQLDEVNEHPLIRWDDPTIDWD